MMRLFVLLVMFPCYGFATPDPCERTDYPVVADKIFKTAVSPTSTGIYVAKGHSKVLVSTKDYIALIEKNLNDDKPYLKAAKLHILSFLGKVNDDDVIDEKEIWINSTGLNAEEQNVATHVMAGLQDAFGHALLTELAAVEVNGELVDSIRVRYLTGIDEKSRASDVYKVHNIMFESGDVLVYQQCWLEWVVH